MKGTLITAILGGVILLFSFGLLLWARLDSDEAQLESVRKNIDKDWGRTVTDGRVRSLAGQFIVEPGLIENLRTKKQGWGETIIELAMARHLTQADAGAYATMAEALGKIESLRGQKLGWGKVADHLGFKLGPVVSAAQQARDEMRREPVPEKFPVQNPGISGKPDSTAQVERPDHHGHVSRAERPARPARAAQAR